MTDYTQTDNPRCLYAAAAAKPFPEWVAADGIPTREETATLSKQAFASEDDRLLPIHTKTATFYSALDYFSRPNEFSEVTYERVKTACDVHGITADIPDYTQVFQDSFEKQAADYIVPVADRFALNFDVEGSQYELLPINDAYDVSLAAEELDKMATEQRIPHELAVAAAVEITKAAADFGVTDIIGFTSTFGVEREADFTKAAAAVASRARSMNYDAYAVAAYGGIIKSAAEGSITAEDAVAKLHVLDRANDVVYSYINPKHGVPAPEQMIYSGISKQAALTQVSDNVLIDGVAVPLSAWNAMDSEVVGFRMSKDASDVITPHIGTRDASEASLAIMDMAQDEQHNLLELLLDARV